MSFLFKRSVSESILPVLSSFTTSHSGVILLGKRAYSNVTKPSAAKSYTQKDFHQFFFPKSRLVKAASKVFFFAGSEVPSMNSVDGTVGSDVCAAVAFLGVVVSSG